MFVDASAIMGILNDEEDAAALAAALDRAGAVYTSPIAVYEATVALMRENRWSCDRASEIVSAFLLECGAEIIAVTAEIGTEAARAYERFGRGRGHPARLNMGDCFAYASARACNAPLLFKGEDFIHTDIPDARGGG